MVNPLTDSRFDHLLLAAYQFDLGRWLEQTQAVKDGRITGQESFVTGKIEPAPEETIASLSFEGSAAEREARAVGLEALSRGEVAMLILNGGLATRFGGAVKGIVEVFDQKSFLALKAEDARRASLDAKTPVPLVLLNSFSTGQLTKAHFASNGFFGLAERDVLFMNQTISVRLDPEGEPFFGEDGAPRYYAPGHGEFFDVLSSSGVRRNLLDRGIKWLTFSNVDNLGATLDPVIIGSHILSRVDMSVEVIEKRRNAQGQFDVGGSPVMVNGQLVVVEGFRFPPEFPQDSLRDFQTNNMVFSLEALGQPMDLPRYLVRKTVDGRPSLAFEAISCEASGKRKSDGSMALSLGLLRVPREGKFGRFFPVKTRQDLEEQREILRNRLVEGWAARASG
jgi:UTP--glucose-1-phosphate uridylyltransferase